VEKFTLKLMSTYQKKEKIIDILEIPITGNEALWKIV